MRKSVRPSTWEAEVEARRLLVPVNYSSAVKAVSD